MNGVLSACFSYLFIYFTLGVPSIKDTQGRNAFDILLQENRNNSENLLRLLRGEVDDEVRKTSAPRQSDGETIADNISMLHISEMGLSTYRETEKEIIGMIYYQIYLLVMF